jgi:hypothetical protein
MIGAGLYLLCFRASVSWREDDIEKMKRSRQSNREICFSIFVLFCVLCEKMWFWLCCYIES